MSRPTIALIFNPAARGDKAARFRKWLGQLPADVALLETFAPGSATGLARQAVKDGFRTVVASGGDGTLSGDVKYNEFSDFDDDDLEIGATTATVGLNYRF